MLLTKSKLEQTLYILLMARKESTQAFLRASYSKDVQSVFDAIEAARTPNQEYEAYFDECERANKIPLPYNQWQANQEKE